MIRIFIHAFSINRSTHGRGKNGWTPVTKNPRPENNTRIKIKYFNARRNIKHLIKQIFYLVIIVFARKKENQIERSVEQTGKCINSKEFALHMDDSIIEH